MQGVHGRRRAGHGDAFWQFRAYSPGDAASAVDWRQSAKADRLFVRETEWEAAQTVLLWRDPSPSMRWRSDRNLEEKAARADLLLLALASLLLRGGERVRLMGSRRAFMGRSALPALAAAMMRAGPVEAEDAETPRHARLVMLGDFLQPLPEMQSVLSRHAARPLRGQMLQILDPAEESLPYSGRIRFDGLEGEAPLLVPRVETIRGIYAERLAAHRESLLAMARAAGWGFSTHRTDQPPHLALLSLWQALAPS